MPETTPSPSITSWVRLEPRCRDATMQEGLRARVYDPLWLLARQWQVGEFEGEDAGSPVQARWRGHSAAVTRLHAGVATPGQPARPQRYDAAALPLEAVVERRRLGAGGAADTGGSIRLAAESGLHFLRLLGAQRTSRSYRAEVIAQHPLAPPSEAERRTLDAETLDYWDLAAGRVPDARRLVAAWRGGDGKRLPLAAELGVADADHAEVDAAIDAWLDHHDTLFAQPDDDGQGAGAGAGAGAGEGEGDAWQRERMEYAFSVGAGLDGGDVTLTAAEYRGGHLDWHSVDVDPAIDLGARLDHAGADIVRTVMPAPVTFRGAPAQRFWEFEDARIDFGLLPAGPGDLPHLLLADFVTDHGNDWYVIPIDLAVGTLTRTRSLVVSDTFGVQTLIRPHQPEVPAALSSNPTSANASSPNGFSMYALSPLQRPAAPDTSAATAHTPSVPVANLFYLAPSLLRSLDGMPREEVLFLRDEMANMAWAVERVMHGRVDQRIDLAVAARSTAVATADAPGSSTPVYRLATEVPENWVPLVAQRQPAPDGSLRLVRAAMLRPDGSNAVHAARSAILAGPPLALHDEEVPREGARVVRGYQCTRWTSGQTVLWLGLRKSVGRAEGSSGLRFDGIEP